MHEFNWPAFFGQLTIAATVGVTITFLTVHLALKRFFKEKFWERRWEAYIGIFESLHHVRNYYDEQWESSIRGNELSKEREDELRKKLDAGRAELRRRIDTGEILMSNEAMVVLKDYVKDVEADTTTGWQEHLDNQLRAANKCVKALVPIARAELEPK